MTRISLRSNLSGNFEPELTIFSKWRFDNEFLNSTAFSKIISFRLWLSKDLSIFFGTYSDALRFLLTRTDFFGNTPSCEIRKYYNGLPVAGSLRRFRYGANKKDYKSLFDNVSASRS